MDVCLTRSCRTRKLNIELRLNSLLTLVTAPSVLSACIIQCCCGNNELVHLAVGRLLSRLPTCSGRWPTIVCSINCCLERPDSIQWAFKSWSSGIGSIRISYLDVSDISGVRLREESRTYQIPRGITVLNVSDGFEGRLLEGHKS